MAPRRLVPLLAASAMLAFTASPDAIAQQVVTSDGPQDVELTVYRNPNRSAGQPMQLRWLNGYALVTETRHVSLPAGEVDLRFEGVAGGIIPQSAIVTGLPEGIVERNRDALLLSPEGLLDASLGRRVTLRRTEPGSGEVSETGAVVRSGPDGMVVIETAAGIEALRCSGVPETLIFDGVPEGLSAEPTLSVRARTSAPIETDVRLSYLATGFDWQANYIASIRPGGERLDLFAWVTLANGDGTSFADADTNAVAGEPNREYVNVTPPASGPIRLRCWQDGIDLSELGEDDMIMLTASRYGRAPPPPPPPPPPPAPPPMMDMAIAVTAVQEDLGDLKLYRIPEPVTVAARSQKQVAMLSQPDVPFELVYRSPPFNVINSGWSGALARTIRMENVTAGGLGLPLPLGQAVVFQEGGDRPILIGEASVDDTPIGGDLELVLGTSSAVRFEYRPEMTGDTRIAAMLVVTNATPDAVDVEVPLFVPGEFPLTQPSARLVSEDGYRVWKVRVPANGSETLRFVIRLPDRN